MKSLRRVWAPILVISAVLGYMLILILPPSVLAGLSKSRRFSNLLLVGWQLGVLGRLGKGKKLINQPAKQPTEQHELRDPLRYL